MFHYNPETFKDLAYEAEYPWPLPDEPPHIMRLYRHCLPYPQSHLFASAGPNEAGPSQPPLPPADPDMPVDPPSPRQLQDMERDLKKALTELELKIQKLKNPQISHPKPIYDRDDLFSLPGHSDESNFSSDPPHQPTGTGPEYSRQYQYPNWDSFVSLLKGQFRNPAIKEEHEKEMYLLKMGNGDAKTYFMKLEELMKLAGLRYDIGEPQPQPQLPTSYVPPFQVEQPIPESQQDLFHTTTHRNATPRPSQPRGVPCTPSPNTTSLKTIPLDEPFPAPPIIIDRPPTAQEAYNLSWYLLGRYEVSIPPAYVEPALPERPISLNRFRIRVVGLEWELQGPIERFPEDKEDDEETVCPNPEEEPHANERGPVLPIILHSPKQAQDTLEPQPTTPPRTPSPDSGSNEPDIPHHDAINDPLNLRSADHDWPALAQVDRDILGPAQSEAWEYQCADLKARAGWHAPICPDMDEWLAINWGDNIPRRGRAAAIQAQIHANSNQ
ncbi:hypothetical protein F5146DRAFT_1145993 [Armillaria mellea]|nr:hypothetical protein F5146DRAFT_1145993 [Armillaria mellea]